MTDLAGRIALVTGSSRGIGHAAALALARSGVDVAVNYLSNEDAARNTLDRIVSLGRRAVAVQADVSVGSEVHRMVETVQDALGGIDILVNNAGIAKRRTIEEVTEADFDEAVTVNLKSVFLVTQAVLPGMRERGWGRIINVSSGAVHTGGIMGPHYTASKAGVEGLTRAYALRLVKEGITVNSVAPSAIKTEIWGDVQVPATYVPLGRMGETDEVADAVVFLAKNGYITGQTILLNGGVLFK